MDAGEHVQIRQHPQLNHTVPFILIELTYDIKLHKTP